MKRKTSKLLYVRDTVRVLTVLFLLPWTSYLVEFFLHIPTITIGAVVVILMYLFFGGFWCGWLCPFGNLDYFVDKVGQKLVPKKWRRDFVLPQKLHNSLGYIRYFFILPFVLLAFYSNGGIMHKIAFSLIALYFTVKAYAILVMPLFMPRFFCKYICFHRALGNIINRLIPLWQIRRNESSCIGCNKCNTMCPMGIDIMHTARIAGGDCIGCLECCDASTCPEKSSSLELYFICWKVSPSVLVVAALTVYIIYCAVRFFSS